VFSFHHTQAYITVGRTPLDEGSARRRDLYLTHKRCIRQTSMPPVRFEPRIPASARPQTYALDRAASGIGIVTVAASLLAGRVGDHGSKPSKEGKFVSSPNLPYRLWEAPSLVFNGPWPCFVGGKAAGV
jgi:hypothetical protein